MSETVSFVFEDSTVGLVYVVHHAQLPYQLSDNGTAVSVKGSGQVCHVINGGDSQHRLSVRELGGPGGQRGKRKSGGWNGGAVIIDGFTEGDYHRIVKRFPWT